MVGWNELLILFYTNPIILVAWWSDFADPHGTYTRIQNGVIQAALSLAAATPKYIHEDQ